LFNKRYFLLLLFYFDRICFGQILETKKKIKIKIKIKIKMKKMKKKTNYFFFSNLSILLLLLLLLQKNRTIFYILNGYLIKIKVPIVNKQAAIGNIIIIPMGFSGVSPSEIKGTTRNEPIPLVNLTVKSLTPV